MATLNDKAFVACANALARRVLADGGAPDADRIAYAFKCCVARPPSKAETDAVLKLLADGRGRYAADAAGAKALAGELPKGVSAADLAAWTVSFGSPAIAVVTESARVAQSSPAIIDAAFALDLLLVEAAPRRPFRPRVRLAH